MSADTLRRAAALMRERAEAAPAGEGWGVDEIGAVWVAHDPHGDSSSCLIENFPLWGEGAAEHIASWHPAVALAVADWLDACALVLEVKPDTSRSLALNVARVYLGSES